MVFYWKCQIWKVERYSQFPNKQFVRMFHTCFDGPAVKALRKSIEYAVNILKLYNGYVEVDVWI